MVSPYQVYLDALRSPDALARRDAAAALSILGPRVLPFLIDLLKNIPAFYYDTDDREASDIARAIGLTLYPDIAVHLLIDVLRTSSETLTRKETAYALQIMGPNAVLAVPALLDLLHEREHPRTRRAAAVALGAIGKNTPHVIQPLIRLLETADPQCQMGGARALGMLCATSSPARRALAAATTSHHQAVRIRATASLAVIENTTAAIIPSLLLSLQTSDVDVRLESALALKMVKPERGAIGTLVTALDGDNSAFVRRELVSVLGGIKDDDAADAPVVVELLAAILLNDPDVRVREAAAEALRLIGRTASLAVDALTSAIRDAAAPVRELAALALQNLGRRANSAAQALRSAIYDLNPAVQIRAAITLVAVASDDPRNAEHLVYMLASRWPELRIVAAAELYRMGKVATAAAMPVLKKMLEEADAWIHAEAKSVIDVIEGRTHPDMRLLMLADHTRLETAAVQPTTTRQNAVEHALKSLERARASHDVAAVMAALDHIESLGVAAKKAAPMLETLEREDQRMDVKSRAVMALQSVDYHTYADLWIDRCRNWSDSWFRHSQTIDKSATGTKVSKEAPKHPHDEPLQEAKMRMKYLDDLLKTVSDAEEERLESLASLIGDFRERVTRPLQDALNSYLGEIARDQKGTVQSKQKLEDNLSSDEKQRIVDTVNFELDRLGLAIKFRGHACNFACTGGTSRGRFLLVPKGSKTALLARVNLDDFLPLELMNTQPDREPSKEWRDREQSRRATKAQSHQPE